MTNHSKGNDMAAPECPFRMWITSDNGICIQICHHDMTHDIIMDVTDANTLISDLTAMVMKAMANDC